MMSRKKHWTTGLFLVVCLAMLLPAVAQRGSQALQSEEMEDYYEKWLKEDVVYIISDEERAVFQQLSTPEEKEQFIEQFWFRRDPDPRTAHNEFKEEHYRRIAYANERFTSGNPGWQTDRGRIYIIHGEPDGIVSRPTGGSYVRPLEEGGGVTAVYPYEKWRYRYLEGVGDDVELEFVDPSESGEFRLATFHWEKDAIIMGRVPGGQTLARQTGLAIQADHPAYTQASGGAGYGPENWYRRQRDAPFQRYETIARVGAAPVIKYRDLKELVEVNIRFETLPFEVTEQYFRLNEAQVLIPVTVQIKNRDVSFQIENNQQTARLAVYGIVASLTNRIVTEFEDDIVIRYRPDEMEEGLLKESAYQKVLPLESRNRYRIDLVVKDLNSGRVGVIRKALIPPAYGEENLEGSSLVLSDSIQPLETVPGTNDMFVLGDVQILPRLNGEFTNTMPLGVYYQVYNASLDQSTLEPSLRVTYNLRRNGELLRTAVDENGESLQFFSGRRVVILKQLSLAGLEPGDYQIEVEVHDRLTDRRLKETGTFFVVRG
jgi:GWxTD domain-containing protein